MKSKKHIEEAIKNIREDREITRELLDDAIKYLAVDDARHKDIGFTLAKYVETLQRSNEQLVKITSLVQKDTKAETGLTSEDKQEIFDLIKEEEHS